MLVLALFSFSFSFSFIVTGTVVWLEDLLVLVSSL